MRFLVAMLLLGLRLLAAAQQSGSVRAADQFIPGATITARNGGAKVIANTDENGRYVLDLLPGVWDVQVEMFGFLPLHAQIEVGNVPEHRDWTLQMPRYGPPAAAAAPRPESAQPAQPPGNSQGGGRRGPGSGRGFGGRGGFAGRGGDGAGRGSLAGRGGRGPAAAQQPNFQNMSVTATEAGEQAKASAANEAPPELESGADANESFLVNGSMSGGLAAATDEQERRDRLMAGGRGPGGPGGPGGGIGMLGGGDGALFNGGAAGGDPLGMNGFGAAGANSGFGADNGGGFGPPGGRGGAGGGPGGGFGGRGGGGRGGGGGGGGRGGRGPAAQRRGPFNGQYASFGNRRRRQPAYSGSIAVTVSNSALNAAPFSLNGQNQVKPSSQRENFTGNIGGPLRIPKLVSNDRWQVYLNLSLGRNRNARNQVSTVPTLAERGGDFSAATVRNTPVLIYDPKSGGPFPGNLIPMARFNAASVALLRYFPEPLYSGIVQNYSNAPSTPSNSHSVGVRLSGAVTTKDRLNFNQQYNGNDAASETLFGFRDTSNGYGLSSSVGWSHSFAAAVQQQRQRILQPQHQHGRAVFRLQRKCGG